MSGRELRSTRADPNRSAADPEPRTKRAIEEKMDVLFVGIGRYVVYSESGNQYEIDIFETACTCPDWQSQTTPTRCKHIRRVDLEIDAGTVPRPDGRIDDSPSTPAHPRKTIPSERWPANANESDGRLVGPIPEFDRYGRSTGATFWRCESCGREAIRRYDLEEHGCDFRRERRETRRTGPARREI